MLGSGCSPRSLRRVELGAYENAQARAGNQDVRQGSRSEGIHFAFCGSDVDDPAGQAARERSSRLSETVQNSSSDHRRAAHSPKVVVRLARKVLCCRSANRVFVLIDRTCLYYAKTSLVSTLQIITSIDVMTTASFTPPTLSFWRLRLGRSTQRSALRLTIMSAQMHALQRFCPRIRACRRLRA